MYLGMTPHWTLGLSLEGPLRTLNHLGTTTKIENKTAETKYDME